MTGLTGRLTPNRNFKLPKLNFTQAARGKLELTELLVELHWQAELASELNLIQWQ